jgi:hypothetical protein
MMVLLLQPENPCFSQFTTTVFALFHTRHLPVFCSGSSYGCSVFLPSAAVSVSWIWPPSVGKPKVRSAVLQVFVKRFLSPSPFFQAFQMNALKGVGEAMHAPSQVWKYCPNLCLSWVTSCMYCMAYFGQPHLLIGSLDLSGELEEHFMCCEGF